MPTLSHAAAPSQILAENPIGLAAGAKLVPGQRGKSHANTSTLFRWIVRGTKDRSGAVVKLEACRLGSRWVTSAAALARFVDRISAEPVTPVTAPPMLTPAQRSRAAAAASAQLDRLGITDA